MTFLQTDFEVVSGDNLLKATRFTPSQQTVTKRILSLHGAGPSGRHRVFYLADMIARNGGEFVCFDFSGHGESTGALADSSLKLRRQETLDVITTAFGGVSPDIMMGSSMGGYVLLETLPYVTPEAIVLLCPAMYNEKAFDVPFTDEFTTILRAPHSYRQNKTAAYLKDYRGRVLLAIGEHDDIIPDEVMEIYRQAAANAAELNDIIIPDAPHTLHVWAAGNPARSDYILNMIERFIFQR